MNEFEFWESVRKKLEAAKAYGLELEVFIHTLRNLTDDDLEILNAMEDALLAWDL